MSAAEAFLSRLTAPGRGAIAVVRVWGPRAIEVADSVFRPARGLRLSETPAGALRLGRVGLGLGDEVVAVVCDPGDGGSHFRWSPIFGRSPTG
jgi:tRNA modification GTPase